MWEEEVLARYKANLLASLGLHQAKWLGSSAKHK